MAMIESWFEQDLKKPVYVKTINGNVFSADNQANLIGVLVTDDGEAAQLGGSVSANIIRADGQTVAQSGTLSGNVCSVVLPAAAYAVPGPLLITMKLAQSGTITTLLAVVTTVYRSSTDAVVDPGTLIPSVQDLIEDIEDATAAIPVAYNACFAPAYSTSGTYAVGDYVTYDGYLYRCVAAISSGESWTAAHWTRVTFGGEVTDLKSAIDLLFYFPTLSSSDVVDGNYVRGDNGATSSNSAYKCTGFIPLSNAVKGTALKSLVTFYSYIGYAFYNASKQYITGGTATSEGISGRVTTEINVTIPENAEYFRTTLWAEFYSDPSSFGIGFQNPLGITETNKNVNTNADNIKELQMRDGVINGYQYDIGFEQGAIGGTGSVFPSDNDIRTGFIPLVPAKYRTHINTTNGHAYALFYDSNKTWISGRNIWNKTTDFDFEVYPDDTVKYVRFDVNIGGSAITPTDNAVILSIIGIYKDIKAVVDATPIIPDYFMADDYLNGKVTDINENCVVKSGTSFAFITDIHLEDNSGSSKPVLKYVMDNAPIPFIITGGDIPTAYSAVSGNEKAEVFKDAQDWLKWVTYWGQDRVYQLRGNHDYVKPSRTDNTKYYNMPNGGVHQFVMSKFERKVHAPNPEMNYYYFDDENQKIRYVVIDGHTYNSNYPNVVVSWVFQDQLQWIADTLLSSDGYSVIVISHETYNPTMTGYSQNLADVGELVGAFKTKGIYRKNYYEQGEVVADFTNSTAELVCFLSGHSHVDESDVDENGVLCISTTCDARYGSGRTLGTVSESAFDVFCIDTDEKTIKTVRIGYGENRGWNYITGETIT